VAKLGRLDILVNNAGWTRRVNHRELEGLTEEVLDRTWAVNVKGPLYCIRAAIPHMLKVGGGAIVNITSIAAFQGAGSSIVYCASKAALGTITKSLARAYAKDNIRVNAIAPGFVISDMGERMAKALGEETLLSGIPLRRAGTPEEIGKLAVFLASADASWITGKIYRIDGGAWM
jgi:3-oxoacyl-[acyl-carrier protein] reductase